MSARFPSSLPVGRPLLTLCPLVCAKTCSAQAGRIHLRDRQDLLDKVAETVFSPPAGCSGCGKVATLCTNDPCGHTGACGDCERAARLLRGQVCGECGLPSRLIEPATTACGICLDRFTAAEMFAVADALAPLEGAGGAGAGATAPPCPHKLCVSPPLISPLLLFSLGCISMVSPY